MIGKYSRINDGHRSKLLISHLHARWTVADPVLTLLGIPVDVRRRIVNDDDAEISSNGAQRNSIDGDPARTQRMTILACSRQQWPRRPTAMPVVPRLT
jgi:hypothetical protein